jgi:cytochrome c oxidase assembly protein subunit 11
MSADAKAKRVRTTALACAGLALGMVGLAYASVPLYDLFCRVTGYDGTPLVGRAPASQVADRTIAVRFDANVAPGLNWRFVPETPEVELKLGETATVFYKVRNEGRSASTGIATFNVQPGQAGAFFVKLQCFCFTEQTLRPGEEIESAVAFYVDPSLADEASLKDLSGITLSYTYFAVKNGEPVATSSAGEAKPKL